LLPAADRVRADGGRVLLLDGLSEASNDDEVIAVLGHELGHVVHRHGMKNLMRSIGLVTVAGVVLGDFSSVASATLATLQVLNHSRDAELEAEAFAQQFLARADLPNGVLRSVWEKFAAARHRSGGALPTWLSSHPATDGRWRAVPDSP